MSQTRSTLEKWVEARQLISKARSDWQTEKETLEQTVQLYEREVKSLDEQLSKVSTNSVQVQKEQAEAEGQQKSAGEALDRARTVAAGLEQELIKQVPQLPAPLQEILRPLLARIPADSKTKATAAERMQVVVGILNELDKFNNAVSVFSERRKNPKGEDIAVETLYVGLGAAYFVNETGDFAGVGVPGPKAWEWSAKPALAAPIREAIRIYRNERPAKFIGLPAAIH